MQQIQSDCEDEASFLIDNSAFEFLTNLINNNRSSLRIINVKDVYFQSESLPGFDRVRQIGDEVVFQSKAIKESNSDGVEEKTLVSSEKSLKNAILERLFLKKIYDDFDWIKNIIYNQDLKGFYQHAKKIAYALLFDANHDFITNSLQRINVKTRICLPQKDHEVHMDLYRGRLSGIIKLDIEFKEGLSCEEKETILNNYSALFKGYKFGEMELKVLEAKNEKELLQFKDTLIYKMMYTTETITEILQSNIEIADSIIPADRIKELDNLLKKEIFSEVTAFTKELQVA